MDNAAQLLRPDEAARRIGVLPHTLQSWRSRGTGPRFVKLSARAVRYDVRDIDAWLAEHTHGGIRDPA